MFRLYSKGCEYAIRALTHIGPANSDDKFQAKSICEKAGIPESFTRKIFQALVQAGFLKASRGPGGGYALAKEPDTVSLLEVIKAVDGAETFSGCIMGLDECSGENPCPLHSVWSVAKEDMLDQLESRTVLDLLNTLGSRDGQGA